MTDLNTGVADDGDLASKIFASDRDRKADFAALDAPEKVDAPEKPVNAEAPNQEQAVVDDAASPQIRDKRGRFEAQVPVSVLTAEREKLQTRAETEAKLRSEAEARADAYAKKIEAFEARQAEIERRIQAVQQPAQLQEEMPDPLIDPEGYFKFQQNRLEEQSRDAILNVSEMNARAKHGDQLIDEATQAAVRSGVNQHLIRMPDPYRALVDWYTRSKAIQEIGPDPKAYREKLEQELRAKILGELKAGGAAAQPQQRFPGTLADATASGPQTAKPISDEELAKNIFGSDRRRSR